MKIYFDGCSNTDGKYLSLVNGIRLGTAYKKIRWTKILSDKLNAQECNYAFSGGSNNRILRNISREYFKEFHTYDLAVIQMTFPHRFEWYDGEGKNFRTIGVDKFRIMTNSKRHFDSFHSFWKSYYEKGMYSDGCGEATEEICFNTVRSICKSKNVPLILLSCNPDTKLQFDYMMKKSHPTKEEQKQLSEDIYEIYTKL
tara:strand:+ start:409 stop:1005 length:597 start_codon:yes stop_codon:yes gene_type:complete